MKATRFAMLTLSLAAATAATAAATTPERFLDKARTLMYQASEEEDLKTFEGVIRQIDETGRSVMLEDAEGRMVTVTWDDDTVFTLNGEDSTRTDALEVGRSAKVSYDSNNAADRVDVSQKESDDDE